MSVQESGKLHEECGVFGVYDKGEAGDVAALTYYGLYALQHRGQESCGMAINDDGVFTLHKDIGLVGDVFTPEKLRALARPGDLILTVGAGDIYLAGEDLVKGGSIG